MSSSLVPSIIPSSMLSPPIGRESANLESAHIESANIESAHIESANIESANIESARIESARIESARGAIIKSVPIEVAREARHERGPPHAGGRGRGNAATRAPAHRGARDPSRSDRRVQQSEPRGEAGGRRGANAMVGLRANCRAMYGMLYVWYAIGVPTRHVWYAICICMVCYMYMYGMLYVYVWYANYRRAHAFAMH